jgi:RNA-binding protein 23/39
MREREREEREKERERRRLEDEQRREQAKQNREIDNLTKDQRTIFVSQLTKKVTEQNLKEFFGQIGRVNDIIMIRDKHTGQHKGFAYVEMASLEDIPNCLLCNDVVPDFQKFAILVKASEAEKNFLAKKESAEKSVKATDGARDGPDCRLYIGNIHVNIDEATLRQVLEHFGPVDSIILHRDDSGASKGFAFVRYRNFENAQGAMAGLAGLDVMGRPLKVGPVLDNLNQQKQAQLAASVIGSQGGASNSGGPVAAGGIGYNSSTGAGMGAGAGIYGQPSGAPQPPSYQNPYQNSYQPAVGPDTTNWKLDDGRGLVMNAQNRMELMAKLGQAAGITVPTLPQPPQQGYYQQQAPVQQSAPQIGGIPSAYLLVSNMFDLASETEPNWDLDMKEDVVEECSKYGPVQHCHVETRRPGGLVLLQFQSPQAAVNAATALNGRFFAGRTISVTYLDATQYGALCA